MSSHSCRHRKNSPMASPCSLQSNLNHRLTHCSSTDCAGNQTWRNPSTGSCGQILITPIVVVSDNSGPRSSFKFRMLALQPMLDTATLSASELELSNQHRSRSASAGKEFLEEASS